LQDVSAMIVALLHDVAEDANFSVDELAKQVKIADLKHNSDLSRIPQEVRTSKDFKRMEKYSRALKILRGD